jgi:hypothetical protein
LEQRCKRAGQSSHCGTPKQAAILDCDRLVGAAFFADFVSDAAVIYREFICFSAFFVNQIENCCKQIGEKMSEIITAMSLARIRGCFLHAGSNAYKGHPPVCPAILSTRYLLFPVALK